MARKAGPEFNRAADALQAWREREKALLDARARKRFEQIRQETEREKKDVKERFWREREERVEREKAQLLLHRPGVALRMLPSAALRESIAYRKAADMVRRAQDHELETVERNGQQREDALLKEEDRRREIAAEKMKREFTARAADRDIRASERESRDRDRGDGGRGM